MQTTGHLLQEAEVPGSGKDERYKICDQRRQLLSSSDRRGSEGKAVMESKVGFRGPKSRRGFRGHVGQGGGKEDMAAPTNLLRSARVQPGRGCLLVGGSLQGKKNAKSNCVPRNSACKASGRGVRAVNLLRSAAFCELGEREPAGPQPPWWEFSAEAGIPARGPGGTSCEIAVATGPAEGNSRHHDF